MNTNTTTLDPATSSQLSNGTSTAINATNTGNIYRITI